MTISLDSPEIQRRSEGASYLIVSAWLDIHREPDANARPPLALLHRPSVETRQIAQSLGGPPAALAPMKGLTHSHQFTSVVIAKLCFPRSAPTGHNAVAISEFRCTGK
jgi:hypothetical protein